MSRRELFHTPARLVGLFLLVVGALFAALAGLGWYLIEQDAGLEERRIRERLDSAATLVCGELERKLSRWEEQMRAVAEGAPANLPSGVTCAVFDPLGGVHPRSGSLAFLPFLPSQEEPFAELFAAAEQHEYREEDCDRAGSLYRELLRREDVRLRAAALMRLARCLRKQKRLQEALAVYEKLAELGGIVVGGSPAEILARRERVVLLEAIGDRGGASREAALLAASLWQGRYPIDEATFNFYRESLPAPPPSVNQALASAEAVRTLWERWRRASDQGAGRISLTACGVLTVALWHSTPAGETVLVAAAEACVQAARQAATSLRVSVEVEDPNHRLNATRSGLQSVAEVLKYPQETGLPLVVRVATADPVLEAGISAKRRNLVIGGLFLVFLVIVGAGYFIFRAVSRELGLARLQSDFVAAVSHEFRTPLTAMCHLTELLEEGTPGEDRLHLYYRALGKESRRLRNMVESLLDFARIEAGRQVYRIEDGDVGVMVKEVVEEFREQTSVDGRRIVFDTPAGALPARVDREAIGRALWNLLDNAVKYSPDSSTVRVTAKAEGTDIAIAVADEGPGISKEEQRSIFRKFTRGAVSRALNIKGTGIGLAIVDHIVKGHDGRVLLESEPERGSRFTILIPGRASRQ